MDLICPRCQASLSPQARFCLECGAPQLTVEAIEPEADDASSPGAYSLNGPQIAWPTAIGTAALLSLPVGLLASLLSFSSLWVIAGGVWTVTLYRQRTTTRISTRLGSRIGCVFGVFAAVVATAIDAGTRLVLRYGLHKGGEIDSSLHAAMQSGIDRVLASNPDAARQIPWFFQFWLSPDGQAGLVLATAILSAGSMLGFSALGGALGARSWGIRRS
jgi:ribosomal protein L40E